MRTAGGRRQIGRLRRPSPLFWTSSIGYRGLLDPRPASLRPQAAASLLGLACYLGSGAFSAWSYPGGTHWDPWTTGFGWTNFWCDLLRPVALNGASNGTGAGAARIALLSLALGLGPFFSIARAELGLAGWRRTLLMTSAWAGRIALILVAAGTGRLSPAVHDGAILLGAPFGLLALTLVVAWSRRLGRLLPVLGAAGLTLGLWNLGQYAREAVLSAPAWSGLPVVQKAATLAVSAFFVVFSLGTWRRAP